MGDPAPQYIPREHVETFARYQRLVRLFEDAVRVPGTNWRIGLDALLGLVPGLGDLAGAAAATYGVWLARRMGAPASLQVRMMGNVAIDALGGALPVLGDVFDIAFRAQVRNRRLLEEWLAAPRSVARRSQLLVGGMATALIVVMLGSAALGIAALGALLTWIGGR